VARNRIIAGLSLATVVVEAPVGSGALITADFALENNREVMVVAGSMLSDKSAGSNALIKDGAMMITSARDILNELHLEDKTSAQSSLGPAVSGTSAEMAIIKALAQKSLATDEIARATKLDAKSVGSTLTLMEVKGTIKNMGAGKFAVIR